MAILLRGLEPGDLGWVVQRHGELYAREYGWDRRFEGLVARVIADYVESFDPAKDKRLDRGIGGDPARLRLLREKEPPHRSAPLAPHRAAGTGFGARYALGRRLHWFSRDAGYAELVLWTNHPLEAARRIYERAGFKLVEEAPHNKFGAELIGQSFSLTL